MKRRVLFLPGAGGDPAFWRPAGDRLPSAWDKVYLRWPGLGNQPPSSAVNGFDDLVRLVEERLGESPVDLVAQSMGGVVALSVALKHPSAVRRLVLAATSGGIDVAAHGVANWRPEYRQLFPRSARWIEEVRVDLTSRLKDVLQPTLLLWGDADPISPASIGRALSGLLPIATLKIVPDGDHSFANEKPESVADAIQAHLA